MNKKHILLLGHTDGYQQFIDCLLDHNCFITWVKAPEKTVSIKEEESTEIEILRLDIIDDFENSMNILRTMNENRPFDAVMSHHEFYQIAKSKIANEFGLFGSPVEKVIHATHKYFMKQCFSEHKVPTADFHFLNLDHDLKSEIETIEKKIAYPLIVKPCNGLGSLGVYKVNNQSEFKSAVRVCRQISYNIKSSSYTKESTNFLIVEKYIDGDEFTVDGFIINGEWVPMISCSKYPPLLGPVFQENVYYFSPDHENIIPKDLNEAAVAALKAVDIGDGPYHIEIRREFGTGKCYIVEMAPRISGMGSTFYNLMLYSTGYNIYELLLKIHLKEKVEIPSFQYDYCTMEYDSFAKKGGIIKEFKNLDCIMEHPNLMHYEFFKKVGDYIGPPGLNPDTTAVFYFRTQNHKESEDIVKMIEDKFEIQVGD